MDVRLKDEREKFQIGEAWYSLDNGLSWTRQQAADASHLGAPYFMVTKIDRDRGEVTLSGAWTDETGTYPPQGLPGTRYPAKEPVTTGKPTSNKYMVGRMVPCLACEGRGYVLVSWVGPGAPDDASAKHIACQVCKGAARVTVEERP